MRLVLFWSCECSSTRGVSLEAGLHLMKLSLPGNASFPAPSPCPPLGWCGARGQLALEAGAGETAFVCVLTFISISPDQRLTSHRCCPSSAFGSASKKWEDHPEGRRCVEHGLSWTSCVLMLWPWLGFMHPWK